MSAALLPCLSSVEEEEEENIQAGQASVVKAAHKNNHLGLK